MKKATREFKFRGKSYNSGFWLYGNLAAPDFTFMDHYMYFEGEPRKVRPDTIGQYTGLKDRKGKEIYEGDILKIGDSRVAEVYWSNEEAQYIAGNDGVELSLNRAYNHDGFGGSAIEIIGNIHDNPELKGGEIC